MTAYYFQFGCGAEFVRASVFQFDSRANRNEVAISQKSSEFNFDSIDQDVLEWLEQMIFTTPTNGSRSARKVANDHQFDRVPWNRLPNNLFDRVAKGISTNPIDPKDRKSRA